MMETYYAGAYWGRRPESAEACARRAETFFGLLAACHPDYAHWFEQGSSTKRARQLPFAPTADTFQRFFGRTRYQSGKDGFHFGAWTGHLNNQGGMVQLACGSRAEASPNGALLHFPSEPPGWTQLVSLPVVTGVLRAMALAWEPDWAVALSDDLRARFSRQNEVDTCVGWLTYLSCRWDELPALPESVRVEPVDDQGSILVLASERLSISNPEHLALGHHVQHVLEAHGLLGPLVARAPR